MDPHDGTLLGRRWKACKELGCCRTTRIAPQDPVGPNDRGYRSQGGKQVPDNTSVGKAERELQSSTDEPTHESTWAKAR